MFANYDYYITAYGGVIIPEAQFLKSEAKAAALIGELSFSRAGTLSFVPEDIKLAACAGAEIFYKYDKALSELSLGIKSESVDGYSVSFENAENVLEACKGEATSAIAIYLPRSHKLRYRGVSYD
ncbi:MAG: hypothetical protein RR234_01145 [Christensenella sp.]